MLSWELEWGSKDTGNICIKLFEITDFAVPSAKLKNEKGEKQIP